MRNITTALLLGSLLSGAAAAQTVDTLDRRVTKLEKEVRAVQREVFPGGDERFFEPEVVTENPADPGGFGAQAATPATVLTERLNALETQVQALTGQIEEMQFRQRQFEQRFETFESDAQFRLSTLEGNPGAVARPGEDADPVNAAILLLQSGDASGAQAAFQTYLDTDESGARASEAGYWLGRSLLAQDQPVQAVQAFLENYQLRRDGERAADSLLWVGRALMQIEPPRPDRACQAFDRLEDEYAGRISDEVASGLVEARMEANCS